MLTEKRMGSPAFHSWDCNPPNNKELWPKKPSCASLSSNISYWDPVEGWRQSSGASSCKLSRNTKKSAIFKQALPAFRRKQDVCASGWIHEHHNCPTLPTQQRLTSSLFLGVRRGHFINSFLWTETKEAYGCLKIRESWEPVPHNKKMIPLSHLDPIK